jgi:O-antigen/teichoic acid export membrane protein
MSEIVNSNLKTTAGKTAIIFIGLIAGNVVWFAAKFLVIRNVTVSDLGIYSLLVAIAGVASLVAYLGVNEGVTKYISTFLGEGKRHEARMVGFAAVQIGIISGVLVFFFLYLCSEVLSLHIFYKPELEHPLKIIALFVPCNVLTIILIGILRGYGFVNARLYCIDIGFPLLFVIFLAFSILLNLPFIGIIYSYAIVSFIVLAAAILYAYQNLGFLPFSLKGSHHMELLSLSGSALLLNLMLVIFSWTDTLMLGRYASTPEVGIYNISIPLAAIMALPHLALGFVLLPLAGEMSARKQSSELKRIYQVITKWIFSATFPLFFILFFFPEMLITFLFGTRFIDAAMPLRILSVGFLFQALMGANTTVMIALGFSREIRNVAILGTLLNIFLNYVLIKHLNYGVIGASVATMISYSVISSLNCMLLYNISKIQPFTLNLLKPILSSAIIGLLIYIAAKSLPLFFWMLPIYFLLFIAGYIFSLVITKSIDKEDRHIFDSLQKKFGLNILKPLKHTDPQ